MSEGELGEGLEAMEGEGQETGKGLKPREGQKLGPWEAGTVVVQEVPGEGEAVAGGEDQQP